MRQTLAVGLVAAATAALGAQTSSKTTAEQNQTAAKPVTVTGCLQPGADQSTFTLVAAASAVASPTGTSGTEGTAGTATARETAPNVQIKTITYLLTAQPSVDLKSHIGHTVEVTGTTPPAQDEVSTTTRDSSASSTGQRPKVETTTKADIIARRLDVTAVKSVSNECHVAK